MAIKSDSGNNAGDRSRPMGTTSKITNADIDAVKADLPNLPIQIGGETRTFAMCGRKKPFARMYNGGLTIDYAWPTVARAYRDGRTLQG
ncbi:MAG: hypothetical protein DRP74_08945 [Candidatus Omnitrophota bacterium]|nr:MAG: hypothetical protein DRP74_08945 [Candidatus Omnitrophota bacterium]